MSRTCLVVFLLVAPVVAREADDVIREADAAADIAAQEARYRAVYEQHANDEYNKFGFRVGGGSTRQILVFCMHADEKTPYYAWKLTVIDVRDDTEPGSTP